jgi:hypothetical protein
MAPKQGAIGRFGSEPNHSDLLPSSSKGFRRGLPGRRSPSPREAPRHSRYLPFRRQLHVTP